MSLPNCYSFYRQHYNHCHKWLQMQGYQGLAIIDHVFPQPNIVTDSQPIDNINNSDEIDSEYLKALEITRRHQRKLKNQRQQDNSDNNFTDYVDISQTESYSIRSKAPDCNSNPDDNSEELTIHDQYQQLLIEMENNLQFNFEKYCDRHQPSFWPVLPIRIQWSSIQ
ncbi:Gem-associated protein 8 [Dermatophagoides pteronyssinus]|uniref:Gem-associated protein 8 n=1 Tax=Dermatophagoides pteronyssinus TaxID=6956 RepID=A0ABQ8JHA0_DERPT|nr:Gem-associated protein 8 [Dermatophagoides pteronyssinus]